MRWTTFWEVCRSCVYRWETGLRPDARRRCVPIRISARVAGSSMCAVGSVVRTTMPTVPPHIDARTEDERVNSMGGTPWPHVALLGAREADCDRWEL